jgi:predicted metal-dependent hydrolase
MRSFDSSSAAYQRGVELLNHGEFFEAHEVLEDVWRDAPEPDRKFLQGLIQVAVAFHHRSCGNLVGFRSVLARACRNLSTYPKVYQRVDLAALLSSLDEWRAVGEGDASRPLQLPAVKFQKW